MSPGLYRLVMKGEEENDVVLLPILARKGMGALA